MIQGLELVASSSTSLDSLISSTSLDSLISSTSLDSLISSTSLDSVLSLSMLGGILSASLLGSVHCAGMCGPLVTVYSALGGASRHEKRFSLHAAYHAARGLSYVGLGAIFGLLGRSLEVAGRLAGVTHVAAIGCGVVVILWGLSALVPTLGFETPVMRFFSPRLIRLGKKPRGVRAALLGAFTPLLPCGWLYAFLIVAAGTGNAPNGALVMGTFWLGTVPALLGMGALVQRFSGAIRTRLPVVTGTALIVIGLLGIAHRLALPISATDVVERTDGAGHLHGEKERCH